MGELRMYGTAPDSIVDGPGLRFGVFVQGCSHHCPGCHNPESQSAEGGQVRTVESIFEEIRTNALIKDVTLSGGEPFEQPEGCLELARLLKDAGYGLWCYTGYLYEDLRNWPADTPEEARKAQTINDLLDVLDVLVDGPYVASLRSYELRWKGSSNQRVIDLTATRQAGEIVLWNDPRQVNPELLRKPPSW